MMRSRQPQSNALLFRCAMPIITALLVTQGSMISTPSPATAAGSASITCIFTRAAAKREEESLSSLVQARQLNPPIVKATDGGELEGWEFWQENEHIIRDAWKEWWNNMTITNNNVQREEKSEDKQACDDTAEQEQVPLPKLIEAEVVDPLLKESVDNMFQHPTAQKEEELGNLWREVIPGVYQYDQFIQPDAIRYIRQHFDACNNAGIPLRRPNGMNRYGLVIDQETEGGVSYPELDQFRDFLVDNYIRPLGRLFFNEYVHDGDDSDSYAFTIHYKGGGDVKLKEHSDASVVTLNINLNLPTDDENDPQQTEYEGSSIIFAENDRDNVNYDNKNTILRFEPGMALLHRGLHRHAALPITTGERYNMVIWLFGQHGYVRFAPYEKEERLGLKGRWKKKKKKKQKRLEEL